MFTNCKFLTFILKHKYHSNCITDFKLSKSQFENKYHHFNDLVKQSIMERRQIKKKQLRSVDIHLVPIYYEDGLQKVAPYYFTHGCFAKSRWIGQPLIKIFSKEFIAYNEEDIAEDISSGMLTVNGNSVPLDYTIQSQDIILKANHRHENHILAHPIRFVHRSDSLVVVDKPPSVPVHQCGRHSVNTLVHMLSRYHGLNNLYLVHRLDKLTSGLMLMATDLKLAQRMQQQVEQRAVRKTYLALVEGDFPLCEVVCDQPISTTPRGELGLVSSAGKPCRTVLQKLAGDGATSLLLCQPLTGRTHQIRIHLQYLGFPILNDPLYNNPFIFGPEKGKDGKIHKSIEQLDQDHIRFLQAYYYNRHILPVVQLPGSLYFIDTPHYKNLASSFPPRPHQVEATCKDCRQPMGEPNPWSLTMALHALRYQGEGWEFETEYPPWAKAMLPSIKL